MSYLQRMYTQETKWLRDWTQDLKQRLSSMLSSTEQETQKLEVSSEELLHMAGNLSNAFYQTHLLLKAYENELERLLSEVTLSDSTVENSGSDQSTVH